MSKRKTIQEIVEETIAVIGTHGRAVITSEEVSDRCVYRMEGEHPGCAVGRCLIPSKYDPNMESEGADLIHTYVEGAEELDDLLIEDYRGHPKYFWTMLQHLHDKEYFWDENNNLSPKGIEYKNKILEKYEN